MSFDQDENQVLLDLDVNQLICDPNENQSVHTQPGDACLCDDCSMYCPLSGYEDFGSEDENCTITEESLLCLKASLTNFPSSVSNVEI